jgi:phage N-6-adenine-methyltransferase
LKEKKMINAGLMSSKTDKWATPQWFFDTLNAHYQFTLDVCAVAENAKCDRFFSPEEDGLKQEWEGVCWMNPPYGLEIIRWVKKAYESSLDGALVVALLPVRTDTAWFWEYVYHRTRIEFIRGRLKFGEGRGSAPFPSMITVWEPANISLIEEENEKLRFNKACFSIRGKCHARS